ncbi:MAG: hemerythrin domain-containing protein, partial [Rhodospirillales bacterium]|nr:hemerythrin domain-containing protein [Rhodospirillales bacterium]
GGPGAEPALRRDHEALAASLDKLRSIADALDDTAPEQAAALIGDANALVRESIVAHERADEGAIHGLLAARRAEPISLAAVSRAHREILHLARQLDQLTEELPAVDRYLVRDAQRLIESLLQIVRIHTAQEEDIYEEFLEP